MKNRIKNVVLILCVTSFFNTQIKAQNTFPANGNVGVGITTPWVPLHVQIAGNVAYPTATNQGNIVQFLQADNNGLEMGVALGTNTRRAWILARHAGTDFYGQHYSTLHLQPRVNDDSYYRGVAMGYSADTQLPIGIGLVVNGNVGVGTTNPLEKLAVNGKMRAHELKVETTGWPDYVFKPDYDLLSLEELESFVQKNGHLPEVPKAADAEADGVWVGEMNKVLLKKIEELTLHLIELKKTVKDQAKRIEVLEDK